MYSDQWGLGALTDCQLDHFESHGVVKPPDGEGEWRTVKDVEKFNVGTTSLGSHRRAESAPVDDGRAKK